MNPKHLMIALMAATALAAGTLLPGAVLADGRHHGHDHGGRHVAKHKHKQPRRIIHEHRYYRDYWPVRRYFRDDGYCPDYGGRNRFSITHSGGWD